MHFILSLNYFCFVVQCFTRTFWWDNESNEAACIEQLRTSLGLFPVCSWPLVRQYTCERPSLCSCQETFDDLARCVFAVTLEGGPAVFWCCAALQCTSPPVLSSPAVGCRKKITSRCHCWFIKLNCFLLSCVPCLSGTSWECLEHECHSLKQGTQHWSGLLNCFFNVITVSFVGNLYSLLSVQSMAITLYAASLSVFIEEEIMTKWGKMFIFRMHFSLVLISFWLLLLRIS